MKKVFCILLFSFAFVIPSYSNSFIDSSINSPDKVTVSLLENQNLDLAQTPSSTPTTL